MVGEGVLLECLESDTVEKVLEAGPDALAALPGFDADTVEAVRAAAKAQQESELASAATEPEPEEAAETSAEVEPAADEPVAESTEPQKEE